MKFDYCIGNPPYQQETENVSETNGQKRSKSVFQYFQESADVIAKDGCIMIYPGARWIQRSGKGMAGFGLKQINDKHLQQLYFYPNSGDIFNGVAIGDGVSIVVKDMKKDTNEFEYIYVEKNKLTTVTIPSPGENIMPLNPNDIFIVKKIEAFMQDNNIVSLHDRVHPQKLFAIESDFIEKNQSVARVLGDGTDFNEETEIKLYANDKAGKAGRTTWFIVPKETITTAVDYIAKWKVVVSSANAGGQKRDNQLEIIDNKSAFGRSRVALASFDTKIEAENFYKYVNSNIIRFAFLMTDEALTTLALKVPDINNYANNGLIDFKGDIDAQLAALMKLTDEEVQYVNNTIKNLRNKKEEM